MDWAPPSLGVAGIMAAVTEYGACTPYGVLVLHLYSPPMYGVSAVLSALVRVASLIMTKFHIDQIPGSSHVSDRKSEIKSFGALDFN